MSDPIPQSVLDAFDKLEKQKIKNDEFVKGKEISDGTTLFDGDSGITADGTSFRADSFNAPETFKPNKEGGDPRAVPVAEYVQRQLEDGGRVETSDRTGFYGRNLSKIKDKDGNNVGDAMVGARVVAPGRGEIGAQGEMTAIAREAMGLPRSTSKELEAMGNEVDYLSLFKTARPEFFVAKDNQGTFSKSWDRGVEQGKESIGGFLDLLGDTFDNESLKATGKEMMSDAQYELMFNKRSVEDYTKADTWEKKYDYMIETLGEMAPGLIVDAVATAATGGAGATAVIARRAAAASIGKAATKGIISKKWLTAGPAISGFVQSAGGANAQLDSQGIDDKQGHAFGSGVVGAAAAALPFDAVLGTIMKRSGIDDAIAGQAIEVAKTSFAKRSLEVGKMTGKAGGVGVLTEGGTEVIQGVIDDIIMASATDKDWKFETVEAIENGLRGMIGGASMGSAAGFASETIQQYNDARKQAAIEFGDGVEREEKVLVEVDENEQEWGDEVERKMNWGVEQGATRAASEEDIDNTIKSEYSAFDRGDIEDGTNDLKDSKKGRTVNPNNFKDLEPTKFRELKAVLEPDGKPVSSVELKKMIQDNVVTEEEVYRFVAHTLNDKGGYVAGSYSSERHDQLRLKALDMIEKSISSNSQKPPADVVRQVSNVINNDNSTVQQIDDAIKAFSPVLHAVMSKESVKYDMPKTWQTYTQKATGDVDAAQQKARENKAAEAKVEADKQAELEKRNEKIKDNPVVDEEEQVTETLKRRLDARKKKNDPKIKRLRRIAKIAEDKSKKSTKNKIAAEGAIKYYDAIAETDDLELLSTAANNFIGTPEPEKNRTKTRDHFARDIKTGQLKATRHQVEVLRAKLLDAIVNVGLNRANTPAGKPYTNSENNQQKDMSFGNIELNDSQLFTALAESNPAYQEEQLNKEIEAEEKAKAELEVKTDDKRVLRRSTPKPFTPSKKVLAESGSLEGVEKTKVKDASNTPKGKPSNVKSTPFPKANKERVANNVVAQAEVDWDKEFKAKQAKAEVAKAEAKDDKARKTSGLNTPKTAQKRSLSKEAQEILNKKNGGKPIVIADDETVPNKMERGRKALEELVRMAKESVNAKMLLDDLKAINKDNPAWMTEVTTDSAGNEIHAMDVLDDMVTQLIASEEAGMTSEVTFNLEMEDDDGNETSFTGDVNPDNNPQNAKDGIDDDRSTVTPINTPGLSERQKEAAKAGFAAQIADTLKQLYQLYPVKPVGTFRTFKEALAKKYFGSLKAYEEYAAKGVSSGPYNLRRADGSNPILEKKRVELKKALDENPDSVLTYDLETSGTDPATDFVVQAAWKIGKGKVVTKTIQLTSEQAKKYIVDMGKVPAIAGSQIYKDIKKSYESDSTMKTWNKFSIPFSELETTLSEKTKTSPNVVSFNGQTFDDMFFSGGITTTHDMRNLANASVGEIRAKGKLIDFMSSEKAHNADADVTMTFDLAKMFADGEPIVNKATGDVYQSSEIDGDNEFIQRESKNGHRPNRVLEEKSLRKLKRLMETSPESAIMHMIELGIFAEGHVIGEFEKTSVATKVKQLADAAKFGLRNGLIKANEVITAGGKQFHVAPLVEMFAGFAHPDFFNSQENPFLAMAKDSENKDSGMNFNFALRDGLYDALSSLAMMGYDIDLGKIPETTVIYSQRGVGDSKNVAMKQVTLADLRSRLDASQTYIDDQYESSTLFDDLSELSEIEDRGTWIPPTPFAKTKNYAPSMTELEMKAFMLELADPETTSERQAEIDSAIEAFNEEYMSHVDQTWQSMRKINEMTQANTRKRDKADADIAQAKAEAPMSNFTALKRGDDRFGDQDDLGSGTEKSTLEADDDSRVIINKKGETVRIKARYKYRHRKNMREKEAPDHFFTSDGERIQVPSDGFIRQSAEYLANLVKNEKRKLLASKDKNAKEHNSKVDPIIDRLEDMYEKRKKQDKAESDKSRAAKAMGPQMIEMTDSERMVEEESQAMEKKLLETKKYNAKKNSNRKLNRSKRTVEKIIKHRKQAKGVFYRILEMTKTRLGRLHPLLEKLATDFSLNRLTYGERLTAQVNKLFTDPKEFERAVRDLEEGRDTPEAKKYMEAIGLATTFIQKFDKSYKGPTGAVITLDIGNIDNDRAAFVTILREGGIKDPERYVESMFNGVGVPELATDLGVAKPTRRKLEELRKVLPKLRQAGFVNNDSVAAMTQYMYSVGSYAAMYEASNGGKLLAQVSEEIHPANKGEYIKLMGGLTGSSAFGVHRYVRRFNSVAMAFQTATILWFAGVASIPELIGTVVRAKNSIDGMGSEIAKLMTGKGRAEIRQLAIDMNVSTSEAMEHSLHALNSMDAMTTGKTAQRINQTVFKLNGQLWLTELNRAFSTSMAVKFIDQHARKDSVTSRRMLAELGIDQKTALKALAPDNKDMQAKEAYELAVHRFVNQSVTNPTSGQLPLIANNPYFAIVTSLKKFFYGFYDNVHKALYRDFVASKKEGDEMRVVANMALAAVLVLPLAAASEVLRELIKYPFGRPEGYKRSTSDFMLSVLGNTGGLGVIQMAQLPMEMRQYDRNPAITFLGPTVGYAWDAINDDLTFARHLPLANQLPWARKPANAFWKDMKGLVLDE